MALLRRGGRAIEGEQESRREQFGNGQEGDAGSESVPEGEKERGPANSQMASQMGRRGDEGEGGKKRTGRFFQQPQGSL
jgi:hypothetical protein